MVSITDRNGSVNASPASPAKPARKTRKRSRGKPIIRPSRARHWLTVGMGCGIPALSLSLSSIGGSLLTEGHTALGGAALALCCGVLAVSLSHLAAAIQDITRSRPWQAWALAIVVDVALVVCELSRVSGYASWLVPVLMVGVTAMSMVLNVWAFKLHD